MLGKEHLFAYIKHKQMPDLIISKQIESTKIIQAYREIFSESSSIKSNSDCIDHIPVDLAPNGISFGTKSIGKV